MFLEKRSICGNADFFNLKKIMLTKQQKTELVKNLVEKIKAAKSAVLVDYKGLKVKDSTDLKRSLRTGGVDYMVVRKTLLDIAFKNAGVEGLDVKSLEGQVALSLSNTDEISGAKLIDAFAKKNENVKMIGGVLGKQVMNAAEVKALAKIPSKEELLAKLVGTLNAPVSGFVNVLAGNLRGLVQALNAIKEQKAQ
jgi:large subunit ribosomal protein L10